MITCTNCGSSKVIKNGKAPHGAQKYLCKKCGKNFTMPLQTITEKVPWYRNNGVIAIITIVFFPLGLSLICAHPTYQKKTKILWTAVVAGVVFLAYTGLFGIAMLLTAALWIWVYKKHPASSAENAPSGKVCNCCGAQLPNSGLCPYCGGITDDGE